MELWTYQRFQQPHLRVDAVEHQQGERVISLRSGTHEYRIALDDDAAATQVAEDLNALRDAAAPLWNTLRESPPGSAWRDLGSFLDQHSLIGEARHDPVEQLNAQQQRIRQCVEATKSAILSGLPAERIALVVAHAAGLQHELCRSAGAALSSACGEDPFDASMQPNFFLALLSVEFEYLRRFAPLTLAAVQLLLGSIAEEPRAEATAAIKQAFGDAAGLYDERDLIAHLWLVGRSLVSSSSEGAARLPTAKIQQPQLASGLEFMRQIELVTRTTLLGWGENPYVTAINKLDGEYSPLVAGPFIEQYHVTRRFVEIIAPLLSMRLSVPLRSMTFQYYGEEYGHEALESTTCEALGVSPAVLGEVVPLPLHFAFVDTLTLLAQVDPITSFAAVMAIEGIFGEPPKMSLRLVAAARRNAAFRRVASDHEELNETLNHNSISRNLFEHLTAVSAGRQATTMRRILFLLELNHRAWADISEFYGQQDQLRLQGAFGERLAPQC